MIPRILLPLPTDMNEGAAIIQPFLDALLVVNIFWQRKYNYPPIKQWARYEREPVGQEDWQPLPALWASKRGDCEDLATAYAAQLCVTGVPARSVCKVAGPATFHVVTVLADGTELDVCRELGMDSFSAAGFSPLNTIKRVARDIIRAARSGNRKKQGQAVTAIRKLKASTSPAAAAVLDEARAISSNKQPKPKKSKGKAVFDVLSEVAEKNLSDEGDDDVDDGEENDDVTND